MNDDAIPAATLIVVRDRSAGPPELLMVERAEGMAFAAGALVFPGGRIDEADRSSRRSLAIDAARGRGDPRDHRGNGGTRRARPCPRSGDRAEPAARTGRRKPFAEVLARSGRTLDAAALTPFARWVPEFHAVRRFDTLFFVAQAPEGDWQPQVIEGECAGASWISAAEVLDRDRAAKHA